MNKFYDWDSKLTINSKLTYPYIQKPGRCLYHYLLLLRLAVWWCCRDLQIPGINTGHGNQHFAQKMKDYSGTKI